MKSLVEELQLIIKGTIERLNLRYCCMKNVCLYLDSRNELLRINIDKIVYFEADGNHTNIVLANQTKGMVRMNLAQTQKALSEHLREQANIFAQMGKKHIINLTYISQIHVLRQKLALSDGERFAFSLDITKEALKKLKGLYERELAVKLNISL